MAASFRGWVIGFLDISTGVASPGARAPLSMIVRGIKGVDLGTSCRTNFCKSYVLEQYADPSRADAGAPYEIPASASTALLTPSCFPEERRAVSCSGLRLDTPKLLEFAGFSLGGSRFPCKFDLSAFLKRLTSFG